MSLLRAYVPSSCCLPFWNCYFMFLGTCAHTIGPSLLPELVAIACPPPVLMPYAGDAGRDRNPNTGMKCRQKETSLAEFFWYQKEMAVSGSGCSKYYSLWSSSSIPSTEIWYLVRIFRVPGTGLIPSQTTTIRRNCPVFDGENVLSLRVLSVTSEDKHQDLYKRIACLHSFMGWWLTCLVNKVANKKNHATCLHLVTSIMSYWMMQSSGSFLVYVHRQCFPSFLSIALKLERNTET